MNLTLMTKRIAFTCASLLLLINTLTAQLDTIHYIPPAFTNNVSQNDIRDHYVVLSTNENTPFFVNIYNNAGREMRVKISKSQPQIVNLGLQYEAWGVIGADDLNTALDDEGMILEATQPFFVNLRHIAGNQGAMLTSKGSVAAGYDFYTGHMFSAYPTNSTLRNHYVSVMATKDNTLVSFSNPDAKYTGQANNTFSVNLNAGQSYVVADMLNNHLNVGDANAINGTHITSNNAIVVNTGSWMGGGNSSSKDMGFDQIVPSDYVGSEYILTKGRGSVNTEVVVVVATTNNTEVKVNDVVFTTLTNAGDHVNIPISSYTTSNNMYVESTHPIYVYQTFAGSSSDATVGMTFIPPLNCLANQKVNIPFATQLIRAVDMTNPNGDSPALTLITKPDATLSINGVDLATVVSSINNSGPDAVPGTDWVSYYITDFNFTGFSATGDWHFEIIADRAVNAELSVRDQWVGAGCFFSGFGEDPFLSKEPLIEGGSACLPDNAILRANGFSSYEWYKNGALLSGESSDSLIPNGLGTYSVRGVTVCDGSEIKSKASKPAEIRPCLSINSISMQEPDMDKDITFTVQLAIPQATDVSFDYATLSGDGEKGAKMSKDFVQKVGTVVIPAGDSSATITVTVLPDLLDEYDEEFYVELSNAVNCDFSVPIGICQILDNDEPPSYHFNGNDRFAVEGTHSKVNFSLGLDAVSGRETWLLVKTKQNFSLAESLQAELGADFEMVVDTLFIPEGETEASKDIDVYDDELAEATEQFYFVVAEAGNLIYNEIDTFKNCQILDNDISVQFVVNDTSTWEGDSMYVRVSIDRPYPIDLAVNYETVDNTATIADNDYIAQKDTLTILAGELSKIISIPTIQDEITESDESFLFKISNAPAWHSNIVKPQGLSLIKNEDCTPQAVDDIFSMSEDASLLGASVLTNDIDICDAPLQVVVDATPSFAQSFNVDANTGAVTYKPITHYFGVDAFSYTLTDADGESSSATVTINIANTNDAPFAVNDIASTDEDVAKIIFPLINDFDIDNSGLSIVAVGGIINGTAEISADKKSITFTPSANYHGTVVFSYTIADNEGDNSSASIQVEVGPVNDLPLAVDDNVSVDEDAVSLAFNPLDNDTDPDNVGIAITSIGTPSFGVLTDLGDGTYTYKPNPDYNGVDQVNYTIEDGDGDAGTGMIHFTINPINDAPVAMADLITINEDTPTEIDVLANDNDVDGNVSPSGVIVTVAPLNGSAAVQLNGNVLYSPNANFHGSDVFSYKLVDDAGAESSEVTVTVTVDPVDDLPVAVDDALSTSEDVAVSIDPSLNDIDNDGSGLTVSILVGPASGIATISGNTIQYTPSDDFNGSDAIQYQITENGEGLGSDIGVITITVNPVNDLPIAINDTVSLLEDTIIEVDVLANDSDPDNGGLSLVTVGSASFGTASISAGKISYSPNANYFGNDTFTYTIQSGDGDEVSAQVVITVTPVDDDAPVATADVVSTDEDVAVTIYPVLNDEDPDLSGLSLSLVSGPTNGSIVLDGDSIVYTPSADYNGLDEITYEITEIGAGNQTSQGIISITVHPVNDVPVANDDAVNSNEDEEADIAVLTNDLDPDNGGLVISSFSPASNGTVSITGGLIKYIPNANYFGGDSFTYTIKDNDGDSATATVTLVIAAVDDDAPVANADAVSTDEDVAVTIYPVLNDEDPDLSGLSLSLVSGPTNGSIVLDGDSIVYTPSADYNGLDEITYEITEIGAGNQTSQGIISITVHPVNDLPVANDDAVNINEDEETDIAVLTNDLDPDNGGLVISSFSPASNGTVSITGGLIKYIPNANYFGGDSFTYTIKDNDGDSATATVTLVIVAVDDDAPVANADAVSTDEDVAVTIYPVLNDEDPDLSGLSLSLVSGPTNGSIVLDGDSIVYTPSADYNGLDEITYEITEIGAGNQTSQGIISITVHPLNDLPIANDDAVNINEDEETDIAVLTNDLDPDNGGLVISSFSPASNGTVSITGGLIKYIPNANYFGGDSFTYTIKDNDGDSATATVTLVIVAVDDDAPVANADAVTTDEDVAVTIYPVLNDEDPDLSGLSLSLVSGPTNGSIVLDGDSIVYTPSADYNGLDEITYEITEIGAGNQTSQGIISITVHPVNDLPVANDDAMNINEDEETDIAVLTNDLDPDNGGLVISSFSPASNGTVSITGGLIKYIPNANYFGGDSFTYTIKDNDGDSATATVTLVIVAVDDDAPVANADAVSTDEDVAVTIYPMLNDEDPDLSGLSLSLVSGPTNGSIVLDGDSIVYTPFLNYYGKDTIVYGIMEIGAGNQVDQDSIFINIALVNDLPIAINDSVTFLEDSTKYIAVLLNDLDPDNSGLRIIDVEDPANGTATIVADSIYYVPDMDYYGEEIFTYSIDDGDGDTVKASIVLTIIADDSDIPVAENDTFNIDEDELISSNLLSNDYDPDRKGVTITVLQEPNLGSYVLGADGLFDYSPIPNVFGYDTLVYTLADLELNTDTAWVYISIASVNDRPIAEDDAAQLLEEAVIDIPFLVNDSDVEAPLSPDSLHIVSDAKNGTLTIVPGSGVITYAPDLNYFGKDSVLYYITDNEGYGSDTAVIRIAVMNVNDLPIAVNDTLEVLEDDSIRIAVLDNDQDIDRSGLTISLIDSCKHGELALRLDTFVYTPDINYFGTDTFVYQIADGENDLAEAFVFINVVSVNDAPIAKNDTVEIDEDTPVDIAILDNDNDVDGTIAPDLVSIIQGPLHGSITYDNILGVLSYIPSVNYFGTDTIRYAIVDDMGVSDSAWVYITVLNINEVPIASNDTFYIKEDSVLLIKPLLNDVDVDFSGISIESISSPLHGNLLTLSEDQFEYHPADNYYGKDSVSYTISDGEGDEASAWIIIHIAFKNDKPEANDDYHILTVQGLNEIDFLQNDKDVETELTTLHAELIDGPFFGMAELNVVSGLLDYTPYDIFFLSDSIIYTITDDDGGIDTAIIIIEDVDSIMDSDKDGIPNSVEGDWDAADLDGTPNYLDLDSDGDDIPDGIEGTEDRDEDGIPDFIDPFDWDGDDDGDLLPNRNEDTNKDNNPYNDDCDNDGIANYLDDDDHCDDLVDVPNGFSPNGDQINDLFVIDGVSNFLGANIQIFNRWGNLVYEKEDYGDTERWGNYDAWWNGRSSRNGNVDVTEGVYFYRLTLGKGRKVKEGFIHIRR